MAKKHLIWSEDTGDLANWQEAIDEAGLTFAPTHEQERFVADLNSDYLADEKMNLDIEVPGTVIAIADLGLWQGRRSGYRMLDSDNVKSIFDVEASEYYCDQYNVKARHTHHDGTNFYEFRYIPDGVDATPLLNAIYEGRATRAMIRRYTRSLRPFVSAVYGWGGKEISVKEVA